MKVNKVVHILRGFFKNGKKSPCLLVRQRAVSAKTNFLENGENLK